MSSLKEKRIGAPIYVRADDLGCRPKRHQPPPHGLEIFSQYREIFKDIGDGHHYCASEIILLFMR